MYCYLPFNRWGESQRCKLPAQELSATKREEESSSMSLTPSAGLSTKLIGSSICKDPTIQTYAKQETQVQSLHQKDPLEKEMATHSSVLAWSIPWTEEPRGHSPWGHKELETSQQLNSNKDPTIQTYANSLENRKKKNTSPTKASTELEKKLKINLIHKHECKSPEQNISKWNPAT